MEVDWYIIKPELERKRAARRLRGPLGVKW